LRRIAKTTPVVETSISPVAAASDPAPANEEPGLAEAGSEQAARPERQARVEKNRDRAREVRPEPAAAKAPTRSPARSRKRSEASKPARDYLESSAFSNRK
jgi:hypothetical protein